jgi:ribosome-associated protein
MLTSLANAVRDTMKEKFAINCKVEGNNRTGWLVIDLDNVIVHLFSPEQREYYDLESLWSEGKVLLRLD